MRPATEIIVDLPSWRRQAARRWQRVEDEVIRRLKPVAITTVDSPQEATEAAEQAIARDHRRLIAVGPQGIANGVLQALMALDAPSRSRYSLGLLTMGLPHPWCASLNIPHGLPNQLNILEGGNTLPMDVGRVMLDGPANGDGGLHQRPSYFLNSAVVGSLAPGPNGGEHTHVGSRLAALGTALWGGWGQVAATVRMVSGTTVLHDGPCGMVLVMGGPFHPWLGRVAPSAGLDDGLLEVGAFSLADMVGRALSAWVLGAFTRSSPLPGQDLHSVEALQVFAPQGPLPVRLDGRMLGYTPAGFSVERRALNVVVPEVAIRLGKGVEQLAARAAGRGLAGYSREAPPLRRASGM